MTALGKTDGAWEAVRLLEPGQELLIKRFPLDPDGYKPSVARIKVSQIGADCLKQYAVTAGAADRYIKVTAL